jgi:hypothetical protein
VSANGYASAPPSEAAAVVPPANAIAHVLVTNLIRTFQLEGRTAVTSPLQELEDNVQYCVTITSLLVTIRIANLTCYTTLWYELMRPTCYVASLLTPLREL